MRKLIEQYAELVAQFAVTYLKDDETGRNTLNSNDFKTPKFYQKWCDHAKDDKDVAKWKESIIAALPMENTDE